MLQIPENKLLTDELLSEANVSRYLSDADGPPHIAPADRDQLLEQFKRESRHEHFGFLLNLRKNRIQYCKGVQRWLGYTDAQFTVKNYMDIIHPAHSIVQGFFALAMFDFLAREKIPANQMLQITYISLLALMNKEGKYIYCKKESRPVLLTKEGKILEYTNEFTVIKAFNNEIFGFRIYDITGQRIDLENKIKLLVRYYFEKSSAFSVQELRILKRYASVKNTTSEKIATSFKIERSTVATYNKRILNKTENIFDHRFENAQKAAAYFNDMALI